MCDRCPGPPHGDRKIAVTRIPVAVDEHVCLEHATAFWTGAATLARALRELDRAVIAGCEADFEAQLLEPEGIPDVSEATLNMLGISGTSPA